MDRPCNTFGKKGSGLFKDTLHDCYIGVVSHKGFVVGTFFVFISVPVGLCSWSGTCYKNAMRGRNNPTGTRQTMEVTILIYLHSLFVLSQ